MSRLKAYYVASTSACPLTAVVAAAFARALGGGARTFRPVVPTDAAGSGEDAALAGIVAAYATASAGAEAMVVLGSDYAGALAPMEYRLNTRIAANLDADLILVFDAAATAAAVDAAIAEATCNHARVRAVVLPAPGVGPLSVPVHTWTPPAAAPTHTESMAGGQFPAGLVGRVASGGVAAALEAIDPAQALIVDADRLDLLLGLVFARALGRPVPRAVLATPPGRLPDDIVELWRSRMAGVPLAWTPHSGPVAGASLASAARAAVDAASVGLDLGRLLPPGPLPETNETTPLRFERGLLDAARRADKHIVLPEGTEDRILRAADRLLADGIVRLTLLGDAAEIEATASRLGLDLSEAQVIDPETDPLRQRFAQEYTELRKAKGVTLEAAYERMADVSYFGTMMVRDELADGMVSGAVHTTAHTIKPAFEVIKTKPGVSVVSSVFFMCLADRVLVFGDCAVNPNPTAQQLAEIAVTSAATARQFGLVPRVAMLSYSTGVSGAGPDVERVAEATELAHALDPGLALDGPLQFDAAIVPTVASTKAPHSPVAGRATVLIFPDLDAGNNTYKAVQRTSGALAVGPVLQGLNKPVNDLSRGALVADIVNTVAITALQAAGT